MDLEQILKGPNKDKGMYLNIHPFIAAYITKGFPSIRSKWFLEHKKWIKIQPRDAYTYLEYRFKDKDGKNIYNIKATSATEVAFFVLVIFDYDCIRQNQLYHA